MIRIDTLNKTYEAGSRHANRVLRDISFTLPDTGFVCIVGASGCGKTSLLNAIGGLDSFDNGTIATDDVSVNRYGSRELERERNNSFGYIFQNYYLLTDHSVAYNIYLGLHSLELTHKEKLRRVRESLRAVNMERFARRIVSDLSGGQQQRVAIARALARRPRVIFADEPTGNLDEENTINICTLLRRISKTSLVVMVTHEEKIARFFADRIITLSEGRIEEDSSSWERGTLAAAGSNIYAGELDEHRSETGQVKLRVLQAADTEPVELTVAVLKDRIILKLDDGRTVSCTTSAEEPVIEEGKRPQLVLEAVDNTPGADRTAQEPPAKSTRAGKGLTGGMMFSEAVRLLRGKGMRFVSTWLFLTAMTVLATFIVSDYVTVSSVDPHDFIITDSHILELSFERGSELPANMTNIQPLIGEYQEYLRSSGLVYDILPYVNTQLRYSTDVFIQMGTVSSSMGSFSHAFITQLSESDLIFGRMPERSDEIVVDRWVLDAFLAKDGIIQSGIPDIERMLGAKLEYFKMAYAPTIVGICDRGDPTIYLPASGMASVGRSGSAVITLSELKALFPGEYDHLKLEANECIVIASNAGAMYHNKVGSSYRVSYNMYLDIVDAIDADTWAYAVIADETLIPMLESMGRATSAFILYCEDKTAMRKFLADGLPEEFQNMLQIKVKDTYTDSYTAYENASHMKADARTIVTVTIIVLCMVMLYLLQRSGVQQRIGMMTVYRLLGIPRRKLLAIFSLESILFSLISVLPASVITWAVIRILSALPSLEFDMLLPPAIAVAVAVITTAYYLAVSLLPTARLLQLPPARLAGKYDL